VSLAADFYCGRRTKKEKLSEELAGVRAEIAAAKGEQPQ
jgi:hypothetical protein